MIRMIKGLGLMALVIFLSVGSAQAHKVTIFAWVEGNRVFTESKFSAGKMVNNGKVEVFDDSGQLLLSGQTDDKGEFSFEIPKIGDLNVVLTAGMGHQNSWRLSAAELGAPSTDMAATAPSEMSPKPPAETRPPIPEAVAPGLTAQAVEAIVARQLEQKLQPLTRMMVAVRDTGPSIGEIFGGIGYIIGLVGLGAYIRYRKDSRRS